MLQRIARSRAAQAQYDYRARKRAKKFCITNEVDRDIVWFLKKSGISDGTKASVAKAYDKIVRDKMAEWLEAHCSNYKGFKEPRQR
jgi:hypothetical protein